VAGLHFKNQRNGPIQSLAPIALNLWPACISKIREIARYKHWSDLFPWVGSSGVVAWQDTYGSVSDVRKKPSKPLLEKSLPTLCQAANECKQAPQHRQILRNQHSQAQELSKVPPWVYTATRRFQLTPFCLTCCRNFKTRPSEQDMLDYFFSLTKFTQLSGVIRLPSFRRIKKQGDDFSYQNIVDKIVTNA